MSTQVLEKLCSERDQARDAAIAIAEAEDFNPEDRAFTELQSRATDLDRQIGSLAALMEQRQTADTIDGKLSKAQKRSDVAARDVEVRPSLGEAFVRSDVYGTYGMRGTSSRFEMDDEQVRALPATLAAWADVIPAGPQFDLTAPELPPMILPLVTTINVSQNSVEYVTYEKVAGGADVVPEGAQKPPVEWAPTVTPASLENIAGYTQLTRQLMEDAAAVTSYVNTELRREVLRKEEQLAVAEVRLAATNTAAGPAGSGVLGAIRAGMAEIENLGYRPNAFLISSDDLISADLQVMNTAGTGPDRRNAFWGLTPVIDPGGTSGTVIVGDFKASTHHYTRSTVSLYITDSHADTFLKNVFTLLAERRSKTVVVRPDCLVSATVTA